MNTRIFATLTAAAALSIIAPKSLGGQPEQEVVVSRAVSVARDIPLNVVSRPVTVARGIPLNVVSRPVTVARGIRFHVVSRPVTLGVCPAGVDVVGTPDCNNNGTLDICDIANGVSEDCNGNDVPDECETLTEGTGSTCNDGIDNDCDGLVDCDDPDCAAAFVCVGACCLQNGGCEEVNVEECTLQGGTPRGVGSVCAGDIDGNGVDDACSLICGNGTCDPGEDSCTCPDDCEAPPLNAIPSFQGLGGLPGVPISSEARGVSADGSTVVGAAASTSSNTEAFRWTQATGMVGLGDLPGSIFWSRGRDVSADGCVVVGDSRSTSSGDFHTEAFYWTQATGMVHLDEVFGAIFETCANGVSADGAVVVGRSRDGNNGKAFRWTQATGSIRLQDVQGSNSNKVGGVSADGSVIVGYAFPTSVGEPYRWTEATGVVGLGDLPGGGNIGKGLGISADGSVLVGFGNSASGQEAFRWEDLNGNGLVDPNEKLDNHPEFGLGDLPGQRFDSEAWDVSADGSVVVGRASPGTGDQAFIWDPVNGMRNLRDVLVNDFALDLTGWRLREARGVSDDGRVIVGFGTSPSGDYEGWIAVLGECVVDAECDDGSMCTTDACDPATHSCQNVPIPGCCETTVDCSDGLFCNGEEQCVDNFCVGGTELCPGQGCDEVSAECVLPCDTCGLVAHWVDTCRAGIEFIPSQALVGIDLDGDCQEDTSLILSGPVAIQHGAGDPVTHTIDTEIVSMNLSGGGVTLRAGAILGLRPSVGQIVEQPGDNTVADSTFAVFFEVTGDGLPGPVYNHDAFQLGSTIDCLPPNTTYVHEQSCIPLYDSPIPGQGMVVANLVSANHTTFPTGACCLPDGSCQDVRVEECTLQDGTPRGAGILCAGDNDGNGVDDACQSDEPCDGCAPGAHWVDTCPAGEDFVPSQALLGIDLNLDCQVDTSLILSGPVAIQHGAGDPITHTIDAEIVSMNLTGGGVTLRAGAIFRLRPSIGQIVEQPGDNTMADSIFDVFFEVSGDGLPSPVYNHDAFQLGSTIDCLPPNTTYVHEQSCIPLYDSPIPGQGMVVANLVSANHTTFPTGACCLPDGSCQDVRVEECTLQDGTPRSAGSVCAGDNDGNGVDDACQPNEPCDGCGLVAHWVDTCPAGEDFVPSQALVGIDLNLDCQVDTSLILSGPVAIQHGAGDPVTHTIDAEIVSMNLTGGGVTLRAGANLGIRPSTGQIVEQPDDNTMADSIFNVFFEVSGDGLPGPVYNHDAFQLGSTIDCLPPNTTYVHEQSCIPLYDSRVPGQGMVVANLVSANHTTFPTGACCLPDGSCQDVRVEDCTLQGGTPRGAGSVCAGDNDGNGVDDACQPNEPCDGCGLVAHWVDTCPAGEDFLRSQALVGIDLDGDCLEDTSLILSGPVAIQHGPGNPVTHTIDAEIVSMNLIGGGVTLRAGAILGLRSSIGQIVEQPGDNTMADSIFDVFFEVTGDGLPGPVYNHDAFQLGSTIDCLPPNTTYVHEQSCIPLFDSRVPGQGMVVANLVSANHMTFPPCGDGVCDSTIGENPCNCPADCQPVQLSEADCADGVDNDCDGFVDCDDPDCALADACKGACCCDATMGDLQYDTCELTDGGSCQSSDGLFQGFGSTCTTEACCLPNGSCADIDARCCDASGGVPKGLGSTCPGDLNGNGVDDICQTDLCEHCGPGEHWIDTCPAGSDTFPSTATAGIDLDLDCLPDTNLVLQGPVTVVRAAGEPHQILPTEIVQMTLTGGGVSLRAGAGTGAGPQGGLLAPTLGQIVEALDVTIGNSSFDVFFEVDLGGGLFAYNQQPFEILAHITCIAPTELYTHPSGGCIPLYTSPVIGEGTIIANMVSANHQPLPGCGNGACDAVSGEDFCSCPVDCDIPAGKDTDCNDNDIPDACDIANGVSADCNDNDVPDECEIAEATSGDCNGNDVPDECDIADEVSDDCNDNDVPDECDITDGPSDDCNANEIPDECDIANGSSQDADGNNIPDECDAVRDCNDNGIPDVEERSKKRAFCILSCQSPCSNGTEWSLRVGWGGSGPDFTELNCPAVPIEGSTRADMAEGLADCINSTVCASITANHIAPPCLIVTAPDTAVEVCVGVAGFPPNCCVSAGLTCTFNPDLVELILSEQDCNGNGIDDAIDIFLETSQDENNNGVPDECEDPDEIPAVSVWGLIILTMLLLTVMKVAFGRQNTERRCA